MALQPECWLSLDPQRQGFPAAVFQLHWRHPTRNVLFVVFQWRWQQRWHRQAERVPIPSQPFSDGAPEGIVPQLGTESAAHLHSIAWEQGWSRQGGDVL